jgi:hypothetical protein
MLIVNTFVRGLSPEYLALRLSSLLDSQFTTIVTAAGAYCVVDVKRTAIRACCQCRSFHYVMGTTFGLAGV